MAKRKESRETASAAAGYWAGRVQGDEDCEAGKTAGLEWGMDHKLSRHWWDGYLDAVLDYAAKPGPPKKKRRITRKKRRLA